MRNVKTVQKILSQNAPLEIITQPDDLNSMLQKEWLRTNRLGAYCSSTVVGCNTRRYHGLLIGAANPPVTRIMALSMVMEQLVVDGKTYDLATSEFPNTFSPLGYEFLVKFRDDTAVEFVYDIDGLKLTKRVLLAEDANAVAIHYEITNPRRAGQLLIRPFVALRDFHALRCVDQPSRFRVETTPDGMVIEDQEIAAPPLQLFSQRANFQADPQWWYRFQYRMDLARGQDGAEDLYSPGVFIWNPGKNKNCELFASLGEKHDFNFNKTVINRRSRQDKFIKSVEHLGTTAVRLAKSSEAFIVDRPTADGQAGASILAGFPWFADWGRDTFIALPGLLLTTKQFELAERVFRTYAGNISQGMIPNRFDDYGGEPHFNSIDASLWFVIAAERFVQAGGDEQFWQDVLLPACRAILEHYRSGTRFGIYADTDGLLTGGSYHTQLTWMDAKLGDEAITSRYGKAVEINALWHSGHCILAERCKSSNPAIAETYARQAEQIAQAFTTTFWNDPFGWLNDCVNEAGWDASLRPNQILAVSLPYSPLSPARQKSVVKTLKETLLTPMGLRSLAREDPRYRPIYGPDWESRERAYHQGTVWGWLIGPFIEAYLKVADPTSRAANVSQANQWLADFDIHINEAGLGFVSEIFDGDSPHHPRGCYAQAWSVAEVLRAKALVAEYEKAE